MVRPTVAPMMTARVHCQGLLNADNNLRGTDGNGQQMQEVFLTQKQNQVGVPSYGKKGPHLYFVDIPKQQLLFS